MRRILLVLFAGILLALGAAPYAVAAPSSGSSDVSITLDQQTLDTTIGQPFGLVSTLRNDGEQAVTGLVAHLDVVATDRGVYVDPEDWSSKRTVYLDPLEPHATVDVLWRVQAVNDGHFVVFVSVTTKDGPAQLAVSDGLRLSAAAERTINASGVLPLVTGVPCAVLALLLVTRARRHAASTPRNRRPRSSN